MITVLDLQSAKILSRFLHPLIIPKIISMHRNNISSRGETTKTPKGMWTLDFDGSHSIFGSGVGIVLITPSKETFYYSYRLEYHYTNNIVE